MKLLILSQADLRAALPMRAAIDAMKNAFAALASGDVVAPPRMAVPVAEHDATTLLMGAHVPSMGLTAKIASVFPRNAATGRAVVSGLVIVLDPATGEPSALMDGSALTAWRTGAASGAATELLAREDARVGALIGCGAQARTQLLAIDAVRDLDEVRVFARTAASVQAFCGELQPAVSTRLRAVVSAEDAVRGADVICAATTSNTPVLDGDHLARGAHVNGIGSFTVDMREIDERSIARATVFVDEVDSALAEAGELVAAEVTGATARERWTPLGLVISGAAAGRTHDDEITLFKSVGHAVQDVAASSRALAFARTHGLGTEIEIR